MAKKVILATLVVLLMVIGGFLVYRTLPVAPAMCPACDRPIMPDMKFTVVEADGKGLDFCCVRCGQHYIKLHPAKIREALATAFDTGKPISMYNAAFVYGSDYAPCCAPPAVVGDEKIAYQRAWDRCYPSLIPFSTRSAAEQFARQHGGTALSYAETKPLEK
jgi:hypothetical protein